MIDFPIDDLLDDAGCVAWLERHLHPRGLRCPQCGPADRRLFRTRGAWPAYRCRACDRYDTTLSGTRLAKTRQPPRKLVLLLRGGASGEPTARLAREPGLSRRQAHTLRQRVQETLYERLPTQVLEQEVRFECDELYQNAGGKRRAAPRPARPAQAAGQQGPRHRHV